MKPYSKEQIEAYNSKLRFVLLNLGSVMRELNVSATDIQGMVTSIVEKSSNAYFGSAIPPTIQHSLNGLKEGQTVECGVCLDTITIQGASQCENCGLQSCAWLGA
jgi:hypothetical protein